MTVLIDAAVCRRLATMVGLVLKVDEAELRNVAANINEAFRIYVASKLIDPIQPKLADTAKRAKKVAELCRKLRVLLDADDQSGKAHPSPYVPIPGFLTDNPAFLVPGVAEHIAFDRGEERSDLARETMLKEAGLRLDNRSISGAHDVARVVVAGARQLELLANAAADRAGSVQKTRKDIALISLFVESKQSFERLHGRKFTLSHKHEKDAGPSEPTSQAGGKPLRWAQELFKIASSRAVGGQSEAVLQKLANQYDSAPDGLGERIRDTKALPEGRSGFYRSKRGRQKP